MSFLRLLSEFVTVVAALVIVLDPLALIPVTLEFSVQLPPREARRVIMRVIGGATILLLFFTITGTWVLTLFNVTLNDLRIAGGLLLLLFALRLVFEGEFGPGKEQGYQAVAVPLISPLLVGPGAITAAIVLAATHGMVLTAIAGVVAMGICMLVLLGSGVVHRLIGDVGTDLASRIMGLLIATIAVSYIRLGVLGLMSAGK